MPRPDKRLPGQSNADYAGRVDPNTKFLGTQSLHGGGDLTIVHRAARAPLVARAPARTHLGEVGGSTRGHATQNSLPSGSCMTTA